MRSSDRPRTAPRQWWAPWPNETWAASFGRGRSIAAGSGDWGGAPVGGRGATGGPPSAAPRPQQRAAQIARGDAPPLLDPLGEVALELEELVGDGDVVVVGNDGPDQGMGRVGPPLEPRQVLPGDPER